MDKFKEYIECHNEGPFLDFKREEYKSPKKYELLRDVLAFANAGVRGDKYVIIGVVKKDGEPKIFPVSDPADAANLQQYVLENIYPEVHITYEPYYYNGDQLMVLTIINPDNAPYEAVKQHLKEDKTIGIQIGERLIRKGSLKKPMNRDDLDRIYQERYAVKTLAGLIDVTFKNGERTLELECIRYISLPSAENRKQIEDEIHWKQELMDRSPRMYLEKFGTNVAGGNDYRSMDLNELRRRLASVDMNFKGQDNYYLYEKRAEKLNFMIYNSGNSQLEDALLEIEFPWINDLFISDHIYLRDAQAAIAQLGDDRPAYPKVTKTDSTVSIRQEIRIFRHHFQQSVFLVPIRISPMIGLRGKTVDIIIKVHGANLTKPEETTLSIIFK